MDGGSGGNHAPRTPLEIGSQDNQGSISKNLSGNGRHSQGGAGKWFFKTVCMLGLDGRRSSRRRAAQVRDMDQGPRRSENDASAVPEFYIFTFRILGAPRIWIVGRREGTDLSSFAVAFVSSPYPPPSSGDLLLHSVRRVVRDQGISRVGFATCCQCDGVTLVTCVARTRQRLTIIDMPPVAE